MSLTGDRRRTATYDPYDPGCLSNPYPALRRLRDEPLVALPHLGCWALARHDDVVAALGDEVRFSSRRGNGPRPERTSSLVALDPPAHGEVRRPVIRAFSRPRTAALDARVGQLAIELVERVAQRASFDVVGDLAEPLAVSSLAELLGLPPDELSTLRTRRAFDPVPLTLRCRRYFHQVLKTRRASPSGVLSEMLEPSNGAPGLTEAGAVEVCLLLVVAGWDTPRDLAAVALHELACRGTTLGASAPALEELVRLVSPVQAVFRTLVDDFELGGGTVPRGARVMLSLASANRDELVWTKPDELMPARFAGAAPTNLGFGWGAHTCVGARLARAQLRAVLHALDVMGLVPVGAGSPAWAPVPWFRRLRCRRLALSPRDEGFSLPGGC